MPAPGWDPLDEEPRAGPAFKRQWLAPQPGFSLFVSLILSPFSLSVVFAGRAAQEVLQF